VGLGPSDGMGRVDGGRGQSLVKTHPLINRGKMHYQRLKFKSCFNENDEETYLNLKQIIYSSN
jgi:hypothetical protein